MQTVAFLMLLSVMVSLAWGQDQGARPRATEFEEADHLLAAKRPQDAIRILETLEVRFRDGDNALETLVRLYAAYSAAGRPVDAQKVSERILAQFPDRPATDPFAWNVVAKAPDADGKARLAADYLKRFPKGKNVAEARKIAEGAAADEARRRIDSAGFDALPGLAEDCYQKRQFSEALRAYERLLPQAKEPDFVAFRIAFCRWWLHDFSAAAKGWMEVAEKYPRSSWAPQALQMAARTQAGPLRNGDAALALFVRIAEQYPGNKEAEKAAYSYAILNYWMKRNAVAKKAFDEFLETYPKSVFVPAAKQIRSRL
jgi:tetratricopeptide (TPR) repeat protein